ncbi:hypothetical protein E1H99_04785 [Enterococcus hirae]|nr:hypothetical protein E1H99_04785 [Enterococcus hirae]
MGEEKSILLYGLRRERSCFFDALVEGEIKITEEICRINKGLRTYIIDNYNEEFYHIMTQQQKRLNSPEAWQQFSKEWLNYVSSGNKELALWKEYYHCLEITSKTQEKLMKDPIKQGCKNGIDMAINHPNIMIYFVLDGLEMEIVTTKAKEYKTGYTGVELRYVYRRWSEAKESIVFFLLNEKIEAPWIKGLHVKDWQEYGDKRMNRLLKEKRYEKQPMILQKSPLTITQENETKELKSLKALQELATKKAVVKEYKGKQIQENCELSIC